MKNLPHSQLQGGQDTLAGAGLCSPAEVFKAGADLSYIPVISQPMKAKQVTGAIFLG